MPFLQLPNNRDPSTSGPLAIGLASWLVGTMLIRLETKTARHTVPPVAIDQRLAANCIGAIAAGR